MQNEYFFSFKELVLWFINNPEKIKNLKNREISFYLMFRVKEQIEILKLVRYLIELEFDNWHNIQNFVISLIVLIESRKELKKVKELKNFKYIENNIY